MWKLFFGKKENGFAKMRKENLQITVRQHILQEEAVSEVHTTTQRSARRKLPPSSDAWVSERRTLGPQ